MTALRYMLFAASLSFGAAAWADEAQRQPSPVADAVFKGVVGKALDAIPMDREDRATLQRGNAVVSGTLAGRSLGAALLGVTNPLFGIVGFAWGIFSAYQIKPEAVKGQAGVATPGTDEAVPLAPPVAFPQPVSLLHLAHLSAREECH